MGVDIVDMVHLLQVLSISLSIDEPRNRVKEEDLDSQLRLQTRSLVVSDPEEEVELSLRFGTSTQGR